MQKALILVDIQNDYFPGGRMEVAHATEAGQAAKTLLSYFRKNNGPIVHIQHISKRKGSTFFLPDTEGVQIHESVLPLPGETILQKYLPNSFVGTGLHEHLAAINVRELVIAGMMSHMCIDATVRGAFDLGYTCLVVHDACATRDLTFNGLEIPAAHVHGAFMSALGAVYAKVLTTKDLVAG